MKKQIKIIETVSKELTGIEIAKYLISIGPYKEKNKAPEKDGTKDCEKNEEK
ncbi:hypothetical protein V7266_27930 [Neobacillus drentensis]|uniref:hypothetical protein n=1 Tax=Neobacillus drentensis TaxID=220684 RepID=UPI002FFE6F43